MIFDSKVWTYDFVKMNIKDVGKMRRGAVDAMIGKYMEILFVEIIIKLFRCLKFSN